MVSFNFGKAIFLSGLILLSFLALPDDTYCQPNLGDFQSLGMSEGLTSTEILTMQLDKKGFLWIGTHFGLNFYDGQQFIRIKQGQDEHSIFGLFINTISYLNDENLLLGTDQGLSTININNFRTSNKLFSEKKEESKNENFIIQIINDGNGNFWVLSLADIKLIDKNLKVLQQYRFKDRENRVVNKNNTPRLISLPNGKLWVLPPLILNISRTNVLFEIDPVEKSIKEIKPGFVKYWYGHLSMVPLDKFRILFLEEMEGKVSTGIFNLKTNKFKSIPFEGYIVHEFCPHIFEYDSRYIIASLYLSSSYYILDKFKEEWRNIKFDKTPKFSKLTSHVLTKDGVHFWGSKEGVLKSIERHDVNNNFNFVPDTCMEFPWTMLAASLNTQDGKTHYFSNNYDYLCVDPIKKTSVYKKLSMKWSLDGHLSAVFNFSKDSFLLNTGRGVRIFDANTYKISLLEAENKPTYIDTDYLFIAQDAEKNFWFCFDRQHGFYKLNSTTRKLSAYLSAIPIKTAITTYCNDTKGNIWFGSRYRNGLIKYNQHSDNFTQFLPMRTDSSFMDNIEELRCDNVNRLWIFTNGYGIYGLDAESLKQKFHLTEKNGISNNYITRVEIDQLNRYWIQTTDKSKFQIINPDNFNIYNYPSFNSTHSDCSIKFIDEKHQFANLYLDDIPRKIDIKSIGTAHDFYGIYIYKLISNDKEIDIDNNKIIHLGYENNNVNIYFTTLNYQDGQENRFSYRIKGLQENWLELKNENIIRLYGLPKGTYTIELKLCLNGGICNIQSLSQLKVQGPFWKSSMFFIILLLLTAGIFIIFNRARINNLLKIQTIRQRISSDLHDEIGSGLSSIQIMSTLMSSEQVPDNKKNEIMLRINEVIKESNQNLADIIWHVSPTNNDFNKIVFRVKKLTEELLELQGIEVDFQNNTEENLYIPFEMGREYYLILKEILNNIAKHSEAGLVKIVLELRDRQLVTQISDNGKGFDKAHVIRGNGLNNIELRMKRIKAKYSIDSSELGTSIEFCMSIRDSNT